MAIQLDKTTAAHPVVGETYSRPFRISSADMTLEKSRMKKIQEDRFFETQPTLPVYRDEVVAVDGFHSKGTLPKVHPLDAAVPAVQKEGKKVNWWVFGVLFAVSIWALGLFGWIYLSTRPSNEVEGGINSFNHYQEVPGACPEDLYASLEEEYEHTFDAGSLEEGLITSKGYSYIRAEVEGGYKTIQLEQENPEQLDRLDAELFGLISLCESADMPAKHWLIGALSDNNSQEINYALSKLLQADRLTSDEAQEKSRKERIHSLIKLRQQMVTHASYPLTRQFYGQVNTTRFPYRLLFEEGEMTELDGVREAEDSLKRLRSQNLYQAVDQYGTFLWHGEKSKLLRQIDCAEDSDQPLRAFQARFEQDFLKQLGGDELEAKWKNPDELIKALRQTRFFLPSHLDSLKGKLFAIYAEHEDLDRRWIAIKEDLLDFAQYFRNKAEEYRQVRDEAVLQTVPKRKTLEALAKWADLNPREGIPKPALSEPVAIAQAYLSQHLLGPIVTKRETDLIGTLGLIPVTRPGTQQVTLLPSRQADRKQYPLGRTYLIRSEEIVDIQSLAGPVDSRAYQLIEEIEITKKSIIGNSEPCPVRVRRRFIPLKGAAG